MPQRSTPIRVPKGHALLQLRDYYLPLAITDNEYWVERYQTHHRFNYKTIETQIALTNSQIKKIKSQLYYLSAA